MKHAWLGAGLALALAGAAWAQDAAPKADTVVATVNGTAITLGHMIALRETLPAQYQQLPDDVLFNGILDQLIQQTALQATVGALSPRDTLTLENARRGYLSSKALQAVVDGAVTDAALQAAYDAKYVNVPAPTEYNASHILVADEAKAKELKAQIDGGADFAELAKANSTDGSAQSGGELGWFGVGMMVKPFEDAVVAMKAGEVAGPIQTQFGWHLIKLNETRPATVPTLDEVREELAAEIESKAVEDHVTALVAAAAVEKPGAAIDPAILKDTTLIGE